MPSGNRRTRHLAWRRNWWLFAALGGFTVAMLVLVGSDAVTPYTTSPSLAAQTRRDAATKRRVIAVARGTAGRDVQNPVDLFDDAIVHRVSITIPPVEYTAMVADYQRDGTKSWHPATVEIDGVRVDRVGVRLKGNSTLIGLRYGGPNSPAPPGIVAALGKLTADEPQKFPFLLRFDRYVEGQRYEGVNELAMRVPGGFGGDATQLTEFVTNRLIARTGQPFLRTAAAGTSINGSPEGYYLLVENPDDFWVRRMEPDAKPALYKAIVGARFRYAGEDPAAYVNVVNQQAGTKRVGLQPFIDFLRFVEQSTDPEFEAQLAQHLDIDEFAQHLAFHNLVVDPDSLAGTGNNYYLLYDPRSGRMSFAAWDQNLAFGRLGFVSSRYRPYYEDGSGIPLAFQKIPGLEELAPGAGLGEKNLLVTRFLAIPAFRDLYDRAYREQFTRLFASGQADKMLDRLGAVIRSANASRNLVDPARFESDLKRDHNFITDRIAYLRTVAPVAPTPSP